MQKNVIFKRILASLIAGVFIGLIISEVAFWFLGETARQPKTIVIVIPKGTAELVARGEQPPSLPQNMSFVAGDTLLVKNEDVANHQLGPLWIPAGASGNLVLGQAKSLAFECSFQPSRYIGFDIHEPLTPATRLYGIVYIGLPLGILIALYAVIMPEKKKAEK